MRRRRGIQQLPCIHYSQYLDTYAQQEHARLPGHDRYRCHQAVLSTYSISPANETSNKYPKLEYCTQYRETDFAFISRLMEQHRNPVLLQAHSGRSHLHLAGSFHQAERMPDPELVPLCAARRQEPRVFTILSSSEFSYANHAGDRQVHSVGLRLCRVQRPITGRHRDQRAAGSEQATKYYDYADSAAAYLKKE